MLTRTARLTGAAVLLFASALPAQENARVTVQVRSGEGPVAAAEVRSAPAAAVRTDAEGRALLRLPAGDRAVTVRKLGFETRALNLSVRAGADTTLDVTLEEAAEELEAIVVTSTRTGQRIENEPTRVEVLARE